MQLPPTVVSAAPPASTGGSPPTLSVRDRQPERFRVALVGTASAGLIDLTEQVRQRSRFIAAVIAASVGTALVLRLVFNAQAIFGGSAEQSQQITSAANHLGLLLAQLWAIVVLRRRAGVTTRTARLGEALVFGTASLFITLHQVGVLILEREYISLHPLTHSMAAALPWTLVVAGYGVLLPNTWRRCAAALCLMVAVALLGNGLGFLLAPQPLQIVTLFCVQKVVWIGGAVAIVVYGAYRIEVLRDQAELGKELGQYRLGRRLGAGGMGEVYLAEHVLLRRPCAIKLIRPEFARDPKQLLRFEREVRATATLTHPNTVQVFDYGSSSDGTFYYVMEYLPGMTLDQLVKLHGPVPPNRAVHFLTQLCTALREAHSIGLIHRDIKPGNVIVCERGGLPDRVKLLDFGLVLPASGRGDGHLTVEGVVTGTPAYMSPEQAGGQEDIDPRSDIYSVGALAYFLLSGQPPFSARNAAKMIAAHLYETPRPLADYCSGVPADLSAVVLKCLAKNRDERYPSVGGLEAALTACHGFPAWTTEDGVAWLLDHAQRRSPADEETIDTTKQFADPVAPNPDATRGS